MWWRGRRTGGGAASPPPPPRAGARPARARRRSTRPAHMPQDALARSASCAHRRRTGHRRHAASASVRSPRSNQRSGSTVQASAVATGRGMVMLDRPDPPSRRRRVRSAASASARRTAARPGPDSAARPAARVWRAVSRSANCWATRRRAAANSSCSRAIVEGRRPFLQVLVRRQDPTQQPDRLVRGVGNPVPGADPVGDQLVDVARCPAVLGGALEHVDPRRAGAVAPSPRRALLVVDPVVCQGERPGVRAVAAR